MSQDVQSLANDQRVYPSAVATAAPIPDLLERMPEAPPTAKFTIRNGEVTDPALYPAMLHFTKKGLCTGTLVAERTLITARHCVINGGKIEVPRRTGSNDTVLGTCSHATTDDGSSAPDLAMCVLDSPVVAAFESLNKNPTRPAASAEVTLAGFGCAAFGKPDPQATFRTGKTNVSSDTNGSTPTLLLHGGASLCLGDSGGAAFLSVGGKRWLVAVNSSVTGAEDSKLATVSAAATSRFINKWAHENGQRLCGFDSYATGCRQ